MIDGVTEALDMIQEKATISEILILNKGSLKILVLSMSFEIDEDLSNSVHTDQVILLAENNKI